MSIDQIAKAITDYQACAANYDMWEHGGKSSASDEQIDKMDAELTKFEQAANAAKAELARLSPAEQAQFKAKYPNLG